MSTSSHVPSGASASKIVRAIPAGSVMSWTQSNVVTRPSRWSAGIGSARGSTKRTLVEPALAAALFGAIEGVVRDVVAHERRRRERFGQQHHGAARPAADVGDGAAGAQALGGTVEQRHDVAQQVRPVPGLEPTLAADRTLDATAVVVVADAGAEALGDRRQCRHRGRELVEQSESGGLVVGVGEHGDRLGRQRESFIVVDRDEAGGGLVVGPLADPPLDETGSSRQLGRRGRRRHRRAPGRARAGHRGAPCPRSSRLRAW